MVSTLTSVTEIPEEEVVDRPPPTSVRRVGSADEIAVIRRRRASS